MDLLEASDAAADIDHDAGQIAAHGRGQLELHDGFEHARWNHVVDRVHPRGVNLNQQFVGLERGARHFGEPDLG
jgi:hypothetical protein